MTFLSSLLLKIPRGTPGSIVKQAMFFFILNNIENPTGYAGGYRHPRFDVFLSAAILKIPRGTPEAIVNQAMTFYP